nr:hypothetical protein [Tanacetum cinerariifolium]
MRLDPTVMDGFSRFMVLICDLLILLLKMMKMMMTYKTDDVERIGSVGSVQKSGSAKNGSRHATCNSTWHLIMSAMSGQLAKEQRRKMQICNGHDK